MVSFKSSSLPGLPLTVIFVATSMVKLCCLPALSLMTSVPPEAETTVPFSSCGSAAVAGLATAIQRIAASPREKKYCAMLNSLRHRSRGTSIVLPGPPAPEQRKAGDANAVPHRPGRRNRSSGRAWGGLDTALCGDDAFTGEEGLKLCLPLIFGRSPWSTSDHKWWLAIDSTSVYLLTAVYVAACSSAG